MPKSIPERLCVLTDQYFPEWSVIEQIGSGSYSRVYRVQDKTGKQASLKWIEYPEDTKEISELRARGASEEAVEEHRRHTLALLQQEIQLQEKLQGQPNIVALHGHAVEKREDGGIDLLMLMDLLQPLPEAVPQMTVADVCRLGKEICGALAVCEKERILHGDIKPENIFRTAEGTYQLGDFGVARRVAGDQTRSMRGTPLYMAPEVKNGAAYDHRADICSLGLVMYELLNAQCPPFVEGQGKAVTPEEDEKSIKTRLAGDPLPPPVQAPEELAEVILRACSYEAEDRFESATEMMQALRQADPGAQGAEKLQGMENRSRHRGAEEQQTAAETCRALPRDTQDLDKNGGKDRRKSRIQEPEEEPPTENPGDGGIGTIVDPGDNPWDEKIRERNHRRKIMIIAVAVVAVIAAIVVGIILINNGSKPMKQLGYTQQGSLCSVSWQNGGGGPWQVTAVGKEEKNTVYDASVKERSVQIRLLPGEEYSVTVDGNPLEVSMQKLPAYSGDLQLEFSNLKSYLKSGNTSPRKNDESSISYSPETGAEGKTAFEIMLTYQSASGSEQETEALCLIQYGNALEEQKITLSVTGQKKSYLSIPLSDVLKKGNVSSGTLQCSIFIGDQLWYEGSFEASRRD